MILLAALFYLDRAQTELVQKPISAHLVLSMILKSMQLIVLQVPALVLWGSFGALYMVMVSIGLQYLQPLLLDDYHMSSMAAHVIWYTVYGLQVIIFWHLFVAVLHTIYNSSRRNSSMQFLVKDNVPGMIFDEIVDDLLDW